MSLRRTKIILALILLLAALAGAALAINRVAGLLAYFQQGADPAAALNLVPNRPPDLHVELQWLPDAADTGRAMEPFTRREIEDAYLRAWLQWNLAYLRGDPAGLRFYFNGPAYDATSAAVANAATQGLHVQQSNLAHRLRLRFYAADGSLIAFTDEFAQVA
ncbi:MAG: hypothetical protein MUD01_26160, partial [Chloroflexaceae bacterium]|nr:hypothetical protein [Chloroflexaceae bacterium]